MKTFILIVLLAMVVGLTYFTRPSEQSFETFLAQPSRVGAADISASDVVYKSRFLWVDVQKDGKTIYTGALGHWFEWGHVVEAPAQKGTVKVPG